MVATWSPKCVGGARHAAPKLITRLRLRLFTLNRPPRAVSALNTPLAQIKRTEGGGRGPRLVPCSWCRDLRPELAAAMPLSRLCRSARVPVGRDAAAAQRGLGHDGKVWARSAVAKASTCEEKPIQSAGWHRDGAGMAEV